MGDRGGFSHSSVGIKCGGSEESWGIVGCFHQQRDGTRSVERPCEGGENHQQRRCLSHEDSGNTRQRRCPSQERQ